jgi:hypothetical protein
MRCVGGNEEERMMMVPTGVASSVMAVIMLIAFW